MKIFISHQKNDALLAARVALRLRNTHQIDYYLDLVDDNIGKSVEDLASYIRRELGGCSQLLAVVSVATKSSWWVPWEIGVATEKNYPISTYAGDSTPLPEYLHKWPYLRSESDLDEYAKLSKSTDTSYRARKGYLSEASARQMSTADFHRQLKSRLGQ